MLKYLITLTCFAAYFQGKITTSFYLNDKDSIRFHLIFFDNFVGFSFISKIALLEESCLKSVHFISSS